MAVLSINKLTKTYGKVKALDNLNLEIESGNIFGLLGPNGSGKTTTLGIILGILGNDSGTYEWFDGQYGDQHRMYIGAILETPNFYPYLDAVDNLEIVARIKNIKQTNFDEILEQVNLANRKTSKFHSYSLGMKQRLAIAATLIGDPEVLIFDEPTNGLDPQGISEVRDVLTRVASNGNTVIMASHLLDEVEKICSHVAIIKDGILRKTGEVGALLNNDAQVHIAAEDMMRLENMLLGLPYIRNVVKRDNFIECNLSKDQNVAELNANAFQQGLLLTHLVSKKQSLEDEFLEITKEQ
jgi:ABC-2 type transport system ATP-binding protein